jgi:RHS repeat-associated protein
MAYSLSGFNGQRPDPVSGHSHLGNGYRAYTPVLERFTAPDSMSPFGAGGINPYAYCAGDPVNRADPSGHFSLGQGLGMALGLVGGFVLGVLTEGMALPVVASLLANMAGDAAIGALSELATEAVDGQQINGRQVGMAALINAGFSLAGFGLGRLSKLKGTRNRPFGGLMMEGEAAGESSASSSRRSSMSSLHASVSGDSTHSGNSMASGNVQFEWGINTPILQPQRLQTLATRAITGNEAAMAQARNLLPSASRNKVNLHYALRRLLTQEGRSDDEMKALYQAAWWRFYRDNSPADLRNAFIETESYLTEPHTLDRFEALVAHANGSFAIDRFGDDIDVIMSDPLEFQTTRAEEDSMLDLAITLGQYRQP